LQIIDAGCTTETATPTAAKITGAQPDAIIGLPCIESLLPVLDVFGPQTIPIVTVGSRAAGPSLRAAKNGWPLWRIGPRETAEADAVVAQLLPLWRAQPFAILNDGSINARDLAGALERAAVDAGSPPLFTDEFRPQRESQTRLIERFRNSGAKHAFIAGDRREIGQIAQEALAGNLTVELAGGEALQAVDAEFALSFGTLLVARDVPLSAEAAAKVAAIRSDPFAEVETYAADTFVAVQVAAALLADRSTTKIETAFGTLSVSPDGFLDPAPYALYRYDGQDFRKVEP
jgi:branched-chain amino acid transport system substrate-binding protein